MKKKKNGVINAITCIVLIVLVAVIIIIAISVLGEEGDNSSHASSSSMLNTESSNSRLEERSSGAVESSTPEESSHDDTSSDIPALSYEQRVGVEYRIDISEYLEYMDPEDNERYLVLVNKTNKVSEDYVPDNMIDVVNTRKDGRATQKMQEAAAKALEALYLEMAEYGITDVSVTSGYRSYAYQNQLFTQNCDNVMSQYSSREECEEAVSWVSARPGTSEHQTGLAVDMHNLGSASSAFKGTEASNWLNENSYRFGFIIRYTDEKSDITKIVDEPWHFRFVGRTAATEIYESGVCLEEYLENR